MTNPTIRQLALRRAADAVTATLDGFMSAELADAPVQVREEYARDEADCRDLYRRASDSVPSVP